MKGRQHFPDLKNIYNHISHNDISAMTDHIYNGGPIRL